MEDETKGTPNSSSKKLHQSGGSIDTYAAQCEKCLKWRIIPTQEEYEEIRSKILEEPFDCEKSPGQSCEDPADLSYDATRTWVIDRPGIPKTPVGFKRSLILRRDFSKMDAYYITPTGKKLRTRNEISAFIQANPKFDAPISNFNFTVPKVMEDTIPPSIAKKNPGSAKKAAKLIQDTPTD